MADTALEGLGKECLYEFARMMTGKELGHGLSRVVYEHPHDPSKVIKVENSACNFQNVHEWQIWQEFQHVPDVAKWLAPCHHISYSGTFLIMERALNLHPDEIPATLPKFLTDHKSDNFGTIGLGKRKRVVCRDYGFLVMTLDTKHRKWRG